MRLVVSGYYGFGNAGDDAVLAGLLELLDAAGVGRSEVTVLSGDPPQTARLHGVHAVSRWNPVAVVAGIRRADGLISGGGGLLQDVTSVRPVTYYAGVMQLARVVGRPYAVLAQGLGPLRRQPNRRIARAALDRAAYVSFRDDHSIALARWIGVTRPVSRVPDPALALGGNHRPGGDGGHVVVAIRGGFPADAVVGPLREAVAELAREHGVIALPMHGRIDRDASTALVAGIAGASVADPNGSLDAKVETIARASVVIGVRLHALVLAAAAGVPAVAISYDPKVDAFAQRAGIAVAASTHSLFDPAQVLRAIRAALRQPRAAYLARIAEMKAEAEAGVRAALDALANGTGRRPSRARS